jgi:hypothetical protein
LVSLKVKIVALLLKKFHCSTELKFAEYHLSRLGMQAFYGRTISKVMGGGGGKKKNRAGETERENIRAPKKFEKKNSCRDFSI